MVTLAALCLAQGIDMDQAAETELARIWTKVEKIRAKQAAKPKHSPLPEASTAAQPVEDFHIGVSVEPHGTHVQVFDGETKLHERFYEMPKQAAQPADGGWDGNGFMSEPWKDGYAAGFEAAKKLFVR